LELGWTESPTHLSSQLLSPRKRRRSRRSRFNGSLVNKILLSYHRMRLCSMDIDDIHRDFHSNSEAISCANSLHRSVTSISLVVKKGVIFRLRLITSRVVLNFPPEARNHFCLMGCSRYISTSPPTNSAFLFVVHNGEIPHRFLRRKCEYRRI
jgi:hypothetical protein